LILELGSLEMPVTIPTRGIFVTCCASTAEHGARSKEHRVRRMIFLVIIRLPAFPISEL
jgi:hypothetical protein